MSKHFCERFLQVSAKIIRKRVVAKGGKIGYNRGITGGFRKKNEGVRFMDLSNITKTVQEIVEKLQGSKDALAAFKKDPVGKVKELLGGADVSSETLNKIVEAVKAKVNVDEVSGIVGKIKGLFGK